MSYSAVVLLAIAASQSGQSGPIWKWVPDGICELRQRLSDGRSVEIGRFPTHNSTTVALVEPGAAGRPWQPIKDAELTLEPGGKVTVDGSFSKGRYRNSRSISLWVEDTDYLGQLGRASKLTMAHREIGAVHAEVPLLGAAVQAVRTCEDMKLREWGIDPGQFASLRSPPLPLSPTYQWFSTDDYPALASMYRVGGLVIAKVDVGVDGAIMGCTVVNRQALTDFHRVVCRAMSERGKFKPAIDATGQPASAPYVVRVRFSVGR